MRTKFEPAPLLHKLAQGREIAGAEGETVPRLRFGEFKKDGPWAKERAGHVFTNRIEKGQSGLPIYSVTQNEGLIPRASLDRRIDDVSEANANKKACKGDVAYNMMRMWQGALGVAQEDCMVSPAYIVLKPLAGAHSLFYHYFLKLPKILITLASHSRGLTKDRLRLYYDDFSQIFLPIPSYFEQQKIAACLSSLDERIAAEVTKLDTLKAHKKGLMQQLFPAEGETVPRQRFAEFREGGEWGSAFGNAIFDQITNKNHNSDLPILAITQEHGAIPRNLIDYHVSVAEKSIEGYKIVEAGEFIISLRSFQGGVEYSAYKGICSPAYVVLRLKCGSSAHFFRHFLKTDQFIGQLNKNIEGLRDGKMVSYKQFSELLLPTPSLQEQQKIAACLSSLDDLITAQAQKIELLKRHKKGLMQQLFPVMEEESA